VDYYFQIIDFPLARSIYWRAKAVLKDRDHEERALGGEKLRELVNEFAENRLQEDISEFIEKYSNKLIEHGGWEIGYFPDDHKDADGVYHFSHADAAYLLENWPDPSNLPDDFPTEHLSDLDALSEILNSGFPYDDIKGCKNLKEWECYALMADRKIREMQLHLGKGSKNHFQLHNLKSKDLAVASQMTTEAMELVCYAERWLWDEQMKKLSAESRHRQDLDLRREMRRSLAQHAARQKLASDPKQLAKQQVKECWELWQKEPARYRGKAAFARDMLNKYEDLKSQPVIEGWCRDWGSSPS